MTLRLIGALLILIGCGGIGFMLAAAYKRELSTLQHLIEALEFMENELSYRKTPLPLLCRYIAATQSGTVKTFFLNLEKELLLQIRPHASACAEVALSKTHQIPRQAKELILKLSRTLGIFDADGQLLGIQSVKSEAVLCLNRMRAEQEQRMKNYRVFGICAGAAIIILFI